MLTKVLLPDCRLVGAVGVPIRVNYVPGVKTLQIDRVNIKHGHNHFSVHTFEMI